MKILLVDADSKIPNLALMKLSTYHKSKGDKVDFKRLGLKFYQHRLNRRVWVDTTKYDQTYCSVVFDGTKDYVRGNNITFGGTGYSLDINLPDEIESLPPDYSIYPENDKSYGFISRGCIRKCKFCKVPAKEGLIHQVNTVEEIYRPEHKEIVFLDNNILALPNHKEVLQELVDKQIKCEFNQGLDIRLLNDANARLLGKMKYNQTYTFAFDNYSLLPMMEKKLPLLSYLHTSWHVKFFVYVHPDMEFHETVNRIEWLRNHKLQTYLMRDATCWDSMYSKFFIDLAGWCNNHHHFVSHNFKEYLNDFRRSKKRI